MDQLNDDFLRPTNVLDTQFRMITFNNLITADPADEMGVKVQRESKAITNVPYCSTMLSP